MNKDEPLSCPPRYPIWRRIGNALIIPLVFAGLTIVVTYPVITEMGTSLAQNPAWGPDALEHTYVLWWFKKALFDLHISPADLRWTHFPAGGYYPLLLTYSTTFLAGLPLLIFFSAVTTYNILFLLTFFLSGLCAYALCFHLTRNRWAGLFGGIVYAFFPNRMAHAFAGHLALVSTYPFPLYLLLLIKTVERPRLSTSLWCGLTLGVCLLVQPTYIIFLLVPITLVWLLYERFALHHAFDRSHWVALARAFGLGVLIATPFFMPALIEQAQGQGNYLQGIDTLHYSADLLGIAAPSPFNPVLNALGIVPSLSKHIVPTSDLIAEVLIYAGMAPLALSALAIVVYRRKLGTWLILASGAAVLSLGPLLKVNGDLFTFSIDRIPSRIPLPYVLLMRLPLVSFSRSPARFNTTLMLMVAIMSAYGLAWGMTRFRNKWSYVIAGVVCMVTLAEFLVIWPLPTTPAQPPAGLADLAGSPDRTAILNLPRKFNAQKTALFYQIFHERPIFEGWVQRPLPTAVKEPAFLEGLLVPPVERDIVPAPPGEVRAAIARASGVGYVIFFPGYAQDAAAQSHLLSETFGRPPSANSEMALYAVPPGPTTVNDLVYALPAEGWWPVEDWQGQPARWMPESAELYLYSPGEQVGALRFTALPVDTEQRLQVKVNSTALPPLVIGDWITYTTPSFTLHPGLNTISFHSLTGCTNLIRDPRCSSIARSAGAECNPSIYWERCLSILFQNIRFAPAMQPVDVTLDNRVRLQSYALSGQARPGQPLSITLDWQAVKSMQQDYVIFIHLLGADGRLVAQHDGVPLGGLYPTSRWLPDDVFTYQATLEIPTDAPTARYDLLAGMYSYPDLKRLPVQSDRPHAQDGLVWLQTVDIQR